MVKKYSNAVAFRIALEDRLSNHAKRHGLSLQRMRKKVAFERFLSRLSAHQQNRFFLKGGNALELRIDQARTTRDIDMILRPDKQSEQTTRQDLLHNVLQKAVKDKSEDFFVFVVERSRMILESPPDGGFRFPVEARLGGRLFERFPVDIVCSSMIIEPIEQVIGNSWLEFAGIEAIQFPAIPQEQQFAEKIHAYTFPRIKNSNSRVKDLIDILLLIQHGNLNRILLVTSIKKIFAFRDTHRIPRKLMLPPPEWQGKFAKLAVECRLQMTLDEAFEKICNYWQGLGIN